MPEYDDRGKVSLWKPDTDHPQAPKLSGTVVAHRSIAEGEKLSIGLWLSDSEHPRAPTMTGKISDYVKKDQQAPPARQTSMPPAPPDFKDDDLPF